MGEIRLILVSFSHSGQLISNFPKTRDRVHVRGSQNFIAGFAQIPRGLWRKSGEGWTPLNSPSGLCHDWIQWVIKITKWRCGLQLSSVCLYRSRGSPTRQVWRQALWSASHVPLVRYCVTTGTTWRLSVASTAAGIPTFLTAKVLTTLTLLSRSFVSLR